MDQPEQDSAAIDKCRSIRNGAALAFLISFLSIYTVPLWPRGIMGGLLGLLVIGALVISGLVLVGAIIARGVIARKLRRQ